MKVPYSWLKEYVDIDISAEELEEKLDAFLACPDACLMVCEIDSEDRVK